MKIPSRPSDGRTSLTIVVVGNCQAEVVCRGLRAEMLGGRFAPIYHFVEIEPALHDQGKADLDDCHILLAQDIANWENYPLRFHIPPGLKMIRFPCIRFASLWPFDSYNGLVDRAAAACARSDPVPVYFDGLLGRLRREIPDKEQRFERYRSLEIDELINFRRAHAIEQHRLLAMDREFGCSIGQFILDEFRRQRLFHSTVQPNANLYAMLMEVVLRQLGIQRSFPVDPRMEMVEGTQVPVHPLVARALDVEWVGTDTTYAFEHGFLTWERYVRRYIERFG
jgi:hypothetical protein